MDVSTQWALLRHNKTGRYVWISENGWYNKTQFTFIKFVANKGEM